MFLQHWQATSLQLFGLQCVVRAAHKGITMDSFSVLFHQPELWAGLVQNLRRYCWQSPGRRTVCVEWSSDVRSTLWCLRFWRRLTLRVCVCVCEKSLVSSIKVDVGKIEKGVDWVWKFEQAGYNILFLPLSAALNPASKAPPCCRQATMTIEDARETCLKTETITMNVLNKEETI